MPAMLTEFKVGTDSVYASFDLGGADDVGVISVRLPAPQSIESAQGTYLVSAGPYYAKMEISFERGLHRVVYALDNTGVALLNGAKTCFPTGSPCVSVFDTVNIRVRPTGALAVALTLYGLEYH